MDAVIAILLRVLKFLNVDKALLEKLAEQARKYGYGVVDAIVAAALAYLLGLLNGQPDWVIGNPSVLAQITDTATTPLGGIGLFALLRILAALFLRKEDR